MNQPSQAMLDHLSPTRVFGKILTLLEGPGLLQERFLRVESHRTAFVPLLLAMHWSRSGHTPQTAGSN